MTQSSGKRVAAQVVCLPNAIACENRNPGAPASEWDIDGAGDPTIQGFATEISVNRGQTVHFKVNTDAAAYQVTIYRLGYYGGLGARRMDSIAPSASLPQVQPACITDVATGLIDCGNWAESAAWSVPASATSGIYIAKLSRSDTGGGSHIPFVVRDDAGHADLLFQTSDTTWQAYNAYGGNNLYHGVAGTQASRAYKVSYNRPITTRGTEGSNSLFNAEYPMVRWLEMNGYDVSYLSGMDTDRRGAVLLNPANHRVFMSVGHDEYWSGGQRTNVENARAAGMHLAFFSGNEVFWKTRWESSIDGTSTPYRTLVTYKETHANAVIDPADPPTWTGSWRDARFSPPADGGRPENALTGTIYMAQCCQQQFPSISVPPAAAALRFWRNSAVATSGGGTLDPRASGDSVSAGGVLGYEFDEDLDNGFRPAGLIPLSSTVATIDEKLQDNGSLYSPGTATHSLTLYRAGSGSLVFGAGTVQWSWGLDNVHDRLPDSVSDYTNTSIQQATVNLLADMGVQPGLLQLDLSPAVPSTDVVPPTSTITSPVNGSSLATGTAVTVTGTASDVDGRVAAVDVSFDHGATWHRATGRESWTIAWTVPSPGGVSIQSRASDDSGNLETPSAGVSVTSTCPCSIWSVSAAPTLADAGDGSAIELGVKFRSDVNGSITGIRFFKSAANTGTHIGRLYSSDGTVLASATFNNETASGWQQVTFGSPVTVAANTIYVASYHTDAGHYSASGAYFATTGVDTAPLHALSNVTSLNGVYQYGAGGFPNSSYNATNYWVDVVLTATMAADTTPPTVTSVVPVANATGVSQSSTVSATFTEAMAAVSITATTIELRTAANTAIAGSVVYDSSAKTATFTPSAPLAQSATYTFIVHGGTGGVTDVAGNPLAASFSSTFTTAAPATCPCTIWNASATPSIVDAGDTSAVEVGTKFRADVNGYITGVRFYKSALNTGTHVASLWTTGGTRLATATFSNETTSGWQQVSFAAPIAVTANSVYIVSYHTDAGHYSANSAYFAGGGVDAAPLHALADGGAGNGVYAYGSGGFPSSSFNGTNYWVDVVFATAVVAVDITPPTVQSVNPSPGSVAPRTTAVTATFNEPMNAATITSSSFDLRDATNALVTATVSYDASTSTAVLSPSAPLTAGASYSARVHGGSSTPHVTDVAGNALAADSTWSFTIASGTACPCSLWGSPTVAVDDAGDAAGVELGVKFRADVDGYVTGIRYYKSAANTGTHVGSLWTANGVLLETATFSQESVSGWQQVTFSAPIAVTANTVYVASYHTNSGHYAAAGGYFVPALDAAPLHALSNVSGGNGVYQYGAGGFPTSSFNATNYWVDVVFATTAPQPTSGVLDTAVADFARGTVDAGGYISHMTDGEVTLAPVVGQEFDGTTMPSGWSAVSWGGATTVTVGGGALNLGGARAATDTFYGPGRTEEFSATFSGAPYEHVGLAVTFGEPLWAIFSSGPGDALYARTNNGVGAVDTPIPGSWFGAPHRFRIDWTATSVTYSVDGVVVATHTVAITDNLRPIVSNYPGDGRTVAVQWVHMSPDAASGTFTSGVFDAASVATWIGATWSGTATAATSLVLSVRSGNTPTPDATWTPFTPAVNGTISTTGRYAQYRLVLTTTDPNQAPVVTDVSLTYMQ